MIGGKNRKWKPQWPRGSSTAQSLLPFLLVSKKEIQYLLGPQQPRLETGWKAGMWAPVRLLGTKAKQALRPLLCHTSGRCCDLDEHKIWMTRSLRLWGR